MRQMTLVNTSVKDSEMDRVTMDSNGIVRVDADRLFYKDFNKLLKDIIITKNPRRIVVHNVYGQRYIGTNLRSDIEIDIYGTPGNDLGAFMDGPVINVYGNAQDGSGNTMNGGEIVVHGNAGDILGLSARGGRIYVRDNVGYRVGIHMKEYELQKPTVVIGGCAQDFLGEYMAGGVIIVMNLKLNGNRTYSANFIGTGMHGGMIFLRGSVDDNQLGKEVGKVELTKEDEDLIEEHVWSYAEHFSAKANEILDAEFTKLIPVSLRPYGKLYAY